MLTQAGIPAPMAHVATSDGPAPLGGTAGGPLAGTATAAITTAPPRRRAPDRQAMAGAGTAAPLGGPFAGTGGAEGPAAAPLRCASGGSVTARPSPALHRWRRYGEPADCCRPPAPIARDDPRYARLPYREGSVHRFRCGAPTAESVTLAVGRLRAAGWRVHRVGDAMAAHRPSGRRWIVGLTVGERRPTWLDRLPVRAGERAA
jgi:hypothetical protein